MEYKQDTGRIKCDYRKRLKRLRDGISGKQYLVFNRAIIGNLERVETFRSAKRIFTYISNGAEADTHTLIRSRIDDLEALAVPKIVNNTMLAVRFPGWKKLAVGPLGILAPVTDDICPPPYDAVITPGLGFTRQGVRLGYGRGYYDRWFAEHPPVIKIGLCYGSQIMDGLPDDDHDVAIDIIVTEREIIHIDRGEINPAGIVPT